QVEINVRSGAVGGNDTSIPVDYQQRVINEFAGRYTGSLIGLQSQVDILAQVVEFKVRFGTGLIDLSCRIPQHGALVGHEVDLLQCFIETHDVGVDGTVPLEVIVLDSAGSGSSRIIDLVVDGQIQNLSADDVGVDVELFAIGFSVLVYHA